MAGKHLTKSKTIAGLQCLRRLWLLVNDPPDYEEAPAGSAIDMGIEIGLKAHLLFPGGILVDQEPWQHAEAVACTTALMADPRIPAIFEAAFEYDNIRVRVDVLERLPEGQWGLREVKSSTGIKDRYLDDIAVQMHVLMGVGLSLASAQLIHVNRDYVRGPDGVDWPVFFTRAEVMNEAASCLPRLLENLPRMRECLYQDTPPAMAPGGHCSEPVECEYWAACTADKPKDWILHLPRLSAERYVTLSKMGIHSIAAIPQDFSLTWKQGIIRDATASGRPYISDDLPRLLKPFGPPACYLDFEAMMPAIPLYEGTRPYQTLPFQWSLHILDEKGGLAHREFLALGDVDPRRAFAEALVTALSDSDYPIIVYSAYEHTQLKKLTVEFPDLKDAIVSIIERLANLLPVVRQAVYFPDFNFSNSIKAVAPALRPGFGYGDLSDVADGEQASAVFTRLASGRICSAGEVARLRRALLAYCARDTMAMVETHAALSRLLREVVVDIRTTGFCPHDSDRIIEVACVELLNGQPTGRVWHSFVSPLMPLPETAQLCTGMTDEFLADKPTFKQVASQIRAFIGASPVVAHGLEFVMPFLDNELCLAGERLLESNVRVDTMQLARRLFPGEPANCQALSERFAIPCPEHIGSLNDAWLVARIYNALAEAEAIRGEAPAF